jgi:hypothetical protein
MIQNIIIPLINNCNVIRINVEFEIERKGVDTIIGRAAHIRFLDLPIFSLMFVHLFANYIE